MRKIAIFIIFVLSFVLYAEAVKTNPTIETIFARKSVRNYKSGTISKEELTLIVKAGMAAPTAVDKRPWEFIVITDKATLKKLSEILPYAKMVKDSSAAIIVAGNLKAQWGGETSDYWIQDCSAATENILLAVESLGYGAVWTGVYPQKERFESVQKLLSMPQHIIPLNLIPIGIPAGVEKPKDKWNEKQLHWNKW